MFGRSQQQGQNNFILGILRATIIYTLLIGLHCLNTWMDLIQLFFNPQLKEIQSKSEVKDTSSCQVEILKVAFMIIVILRKFKSDIFLALHSNVQYFNYYASYFTQ